MTRKRRVNELFTSSLFTYAAENTLEIQLHDDITDEKYYNIGDTVNFNAHKYCIINIENGKVELEDEDFPLTFKIISFDELLEGVTESERKIFKNYAPSASKNTFVADINEYIGAVITEDGRKYRIKEVNGDTVALVDIQSLDMLFIEVIQYRNVGEIIPLLKNVKLVSRKTDNTKRKAEDKKPSQPNNPESANAVSSLFDILNDDCVIKANNIQSNDDFVCFHYENSEESYVTKGQRISNNIKAIRVLKTLADEERKATNEEQQILSLFSGWGGLQEAFDEKNNHYNELMDILNPVEYREAKKSFLSAFYTPLEIIKPIYKMLENFGFNGGKVLEPSCGIGKFIGAMPPEMLKNSLVYCSDIDSISSEITKYLYPSAKVKTSSFENTDYPDEYFDLAITNVPFDEIKVNDRVYNRFNFYIHDYFICKMVDKVRPGGFVVALTSNGTMDKADKKARQYIADKAKLVGAVRLPNGAFGNTHTDAVTDIIVLQKLSEGEISDTNWVISMKQQLDGVEFNINSYFVENGHFLGDMEVISGQFGNKVSFVGNLDADKLMNTLNGFEAIYNEQKAVANEDGEVVRIELPANLYEKPNLSYLIYENIIWYKNGGYLEKYISPNAKAEERVKALIPLKDVLMELMEAQLENEGDSEIKLLQEKLSYRYDSFVAKYGYISSRANSMAFREDCKYPLLCSLEIFDDDGEYIGKAEIFTKRTIKTYIEPKVDNAEDALYVSIAEKGGIDFEYMSELTHLTADELKAELTQQLKLFKVPFSDLYEDADTYLSGYVKEKLTVAKIAAEDDENFTRNVLALEKVQPSDIPAEDIFAPIGATWIPNDVYEEFMYELFETPEWLKSKKEKNSNDSNLVRVCFYNDKYYISNKKMDDYRVQITMTYGTNRRSAYELLEDALNLVTTRVYDYVESDGKSKRVLNEKETALAQTKQEEIKIRFNDWLWKDFDRRERLVRKYNDEMNVIVEREYDGSHIRFEGMNAQIKLEPHQKNAVARAILSGNELLAHVVGAGKTFSMIAIAMEKKRLGLCNKSLFAVPNHLVEQWSGEFMRLYPFANVLITSKKDFEKRNRNKFCAKIATGNYDAVIMSHEQFKSIPLSKERQLEELYKEIDQIELSLSECIDSEDDNIQAKNYTERQLEIAKNNAEKKIEKLMDTPRDNCVTFEELGVDLLLLDEAHMFKNLAVFTKLRNVAGLTNSNSKKAQDLLMKCNYLNEITDYKGIVFATGTPISNAICELYVMQKYLEPQHLETAHIYTFDGWISRFASTETKFEVKPEGTGYRAVVRVSKYHNLPELMKLFRIVADIRVADQLNLDVPTAKQHNIAVNPSEIQKDIVLSFGERADAIRNGMVNREVDNMLCVTNDGRKLAIDQRMYDVNLPDDKKSKLNRCARTVYIIWKWTKEVKASQLVFLDTGTPKHNDENNTSFDAYNDFKGKLISFGVPTEEIAFIHDADTDAKKKVLFEKVNKGEVRILLGSTEKLGAGTNVQKRLFAIHNIDCPWRPSDLEQRRGRIVRRGNMNRVIHIYSYVTKNTFDTYLYQTVLSKAEFISQIMSSKVSQREMDDIDTSCLNYAAIKALSTGNPVIKEKLELEEKIAKLKIQRSAFLSKRLSLETKIRKTLPLEIEANEGRLQAMKADWDMVQNDKTFDKEKHFAPLTLKDRVFDIDNKKKASEMLQFYVDNTKNINRTTIGQYRGFTMATAYDMMNFKIVMYLISPNAGFSYPMNVGKDGLGNITRMNNLIESLPEGITKIEQELERACMDLEQAKIEFEKPFEKENEYQQMAIRIAEINNELAVNVNGVENIIED